MKNLSKVALFLTTMLLGISGANAQTNYVPDPSNYNIVNGTISEQLLRNYLKRSISIVDLNDGNIPDGCSKSIDNNNYQCWLSFIHDTHPKLIMNAANQPAFFGTQNFGFENSDLNGVPNPYYAADVNNTPSRNCDFFKACQQTESDVHSIDAQIILGASLQEKIHNAGMTINQAMQIPQYVRQNLWNDNGPIPTDLVAQELYNYFNQANPTIDINYAWSTTATFRSFPPSFIQYNSAPAHPCSYQYLDGNGNVLANTNTFKFDFTKLFFPWDMQNYLDKMALRTKCVNAANAYGPVTAEKLIAANLVRDLLFFGHDDLPGHDEMTPDGLHLDITQPQTIAFLYYLGTQFIDLGYETLFIGEMDGIVAKYDAAFNNIHIDFLCRMLRQYAKAPNRNSQWPGGLHSRRGFVLIGADCNNLYVGNGNNQNLVFDYQVRKTYLKETRDRYHSNNTFGTDLIYSNGNFTGNTPGLLSFGDGINTTGAFDGVAHGSLMPCSDCDYEALINKADAAHGVDDQGSIGNDPYTKMLGGHNPLGWTSSTRANPYIVWLDNTGGIIQYENSNNPPCTPPPFGYCLPPHDNSSSSFPWSWDEITWFSQQSELYRNHFLVYAWNRVRCLSDQSGYFCMPGRVGVGAWLDNNSKPVYGIYESFNSASCSGGNQQETIKDIWKANDNPPNTTPPTVISGADVRYYNRWANDFKTNFSTSLPTDGIFYFGDFNGDGNIDILETADPNGTRWAGTKVFLNNGSGGFNFSSPNFTNAAEGWGERFYIGDFNGDGRDDYILTDNIEVNSYWAGYRVYTSSGSGSGLTFSLACTGSFPSCGELLYIGDFNGDKYSDFLVTSNPPDNPGSNWFGNELFLNNAGLSMSFSQPSGYNSTFPSSGEQIYVGDFNGDKKDDILVTANRARITNQWLWTGYEVYLSNGTAFARHAKGIWPSWGEQLAIGDWNKDGFSDMTAIVNEELFSWRGSKIYLSNNLGNHFIYAFDDANVGNPRSFLSSTRRIFSHRNKLYTLDSIANTAPVLTEFVAEHCSQTITNSERIVRSEPSDVSHQSVIISSNGDGQEAFSVSPNPAHTLVKVISKDQLQYPATISLKDLNGQVLLKSDYKGEFQINLSQYSNGIYILSIQTTGKIYNYKIVKD